MNDELVGLEKHEIEYLARKHWLSVEQVRVVIQVTGAQSQKEIERALVLAFGHQQNSS